MSYKQLKKADASVKDGYGWCLRMTRKVFGVGAHYATAWDAWVGAKHRSTSRTMPNVAVPVYFSYTGTFSGVRKNWGHVVAYIPGRGFLSSPASGTGQLWAKTIAEMERLIPGSKYVGWALDLNGVMVAEKVAAAKAPAAKPAPAKTTTTAKKGQFVTLTTEWWAYVTAADAKATRDWKIKLKPGKYEITQTHNGVPHLKRVSGSGMGWVHPSVLTTQKVTSGTTTAVTYYTVKKGDTLSKIASRHGTTWQALQKLNGIKNANVIHVGQKIRVK